MQKSKIEWTDYTVNPVKGLCPMACDYCYARRMYKRFNWNPEIRLDWSVANDIAKIKKPSRIFWGSTFELFHDCVKPEWLDLIFNYIRKFCSQHTNIFLTKKPSNVIKYLGGNPQLTHYRKAKSLPENCWIGISITNHLDAPKARDLLQETQIAKVRFLSIEPFLGHMDKWSLNNVIKLANWIIIGQQTPVRNETRPNPDWIREIITSANQLNTPVFIKNNIINDPIMDLRLTEMRQEFPK